ncbi:MAG: DUF1015 domain-containing protein [Deltaproteobacteria bacterium]|nr:DUF1015 domain-containing protein [Deltaproteobacteria bacterium]MBI3076639.1 DUF1015 domain-containing protein [Deltaproteobacteria bacterium]
MAVIVPFRGVRYNPQVVGDLSAVTTPPYDVISPEQQRRLYARHPHNAIRLELGMNDPGERGGEDRYTRAAAYFRNWLDSGVLAQDQAPALYLYEQRFRLQGDQEHTRRGIIARVRLEALGGVALPHERTLAAPKEDRFRLLRAARVNFSPIFSLYDDPSGAVLGPLEPLFAREPAAEARDDDGGEHRLWVVTDPARHHEVGRAMAPRPFVIADGHHRYETCLRFRDLMRAEHPGWTGQEGYHFALMYFCSARDKGLCILPTHRVVSRVPGLEAAALEARLRPHFDLERHPWGGSDEAAVRARWVRRLEEVGESRPCVGVYARGSDAYLVVTPRTGLDLDQVLAHVPVTLRQTDVVILHELLLRRALGLGEGELEGQLTYERDTEEVLGEVQAGMGQLAFLLRPPRVQQVMEVALSGQTLPQKTTYFYPKLLTGLVFNPLDLDEPAAPPA